MHDFLYPIHLNSTNHGLVKKREHERKCSYHTHKTIALKLEIELLIIHSYNSSHHTIYDNSLDSIISKRLV
jgi:hypothetical protein